MKIHNLYTDENGELHFRDIEVEWIAERRGSKLSKRFPATGVIFRETEAEHNVDWHPAPRRQYIVNLDAGVKITASDGESRFIARRRRDPGRGHDRQGPPVRPRRRQDPPFAVYPDRIAGPIE